MCGLSVSLLKHSFNNLLILQHVGMKASSGFMKFRDVQIAETQLLSSKSSWVIRRRERKRLWCFNISVINRRRLARADTPLISQRIHKWQQNQKAWPRAHKPRGRKEELLGSKRVGAANGKSLGQDKARWAAILAHSSDLGLWDKSLLLCGPGTHICIMTGLAWVISEGCSVLTYKSTAWIGRVLITLSTGWKNRPALWSMNCTIKLWKLESVSYSSAQRFLGQICRWAIERLKHRYRFKYRRDFALAIEIDLDRYLFRFRGRYRHKLGLPSG